MIKRLRDDVIEPELELGLPAWKRTPREDDYVSKPSSAMQRARPLPVSVLEALHDSEDGREIEGYDGEDDGGDAL